MRENGIYGYASAEEKAARIAADSERAREVARAQRESETAKAGGWRARWTPERKAKVGNAALAVGRAAGKALKVAALGTVVIGSLIFKKAADQNPTKRML